MNIWEIWMGTGVAFVIIGIVLVGVGLFRRKPKMSTIWIAGPVASPVEPLRIQLGRPVWATCIRDQRGVVLLVKYFSFSVDEPTRIRVEWVVNAEHGTAMRWFEYVLEEPKG